MWASGSREARLLLPLVQPRQIPSVRERDARTDKHVPLLSLSVSLSSSPLLPLSLSSPISPRRMPQHITPEMLRTPLHEIALTIKLLRLGEIPPFLSKALEPPSPTSVTEAMVLLHGVCL